MEKIICDVLVIGGGPSGGVAASIAKMSYPEKDIYVIRDQAEQMVPCAIPYIFGPTLGSSEKNIASCAQAEKLGITPLLGIVERVDIKEKKVYSEKHIISYDKLIFATGSVPFVHHGLRDGLKMEGVFTIPKNKSKIDQLKNYSESRTKIAVVGTGFIGIEVAMEFAEAGKEVTLIGGSRHILKNAFDTELAIEAEKNILAAGITLCTGDYVDSIVGDNAKATGVKLCSGTVIDAEVIVLATGYEANTKLAKEAGLKLNKYNAIEVNEYMRTENESIFAVGDCAARYDFILREPSKVMLASTSAAEGRVAGVSLYQIKYLKGFNGTIAIFSTVIGNKAFSSAGLTEEQAKKANIVTGSFEGMNRHPGTIPGATKQMVKLIAMRNSGRIIGGQIIGGVEAGEMINIIGMMIESKLTIYSLLSLQVSTQPMLTAAPTSYPIVMAAIMIANKLSHQTDI